MPEREKGAIEYRTFPVTQLTYENRSGEGELENKRIVGHAAIFNVIGDGGWFREKIAPGAFAKSIINDDIRALFNHDKNFVLGRNRAQPVPTLDLREDANGLWIENDPPETQLIRDLVISPIIRGDITQMSFGFEIIDEERIRGKGNEPDLFILREVKLWDVSPVTFPFYQQTDVSVHSREAWAESQRTETKSIPVGKRLELLRRALNQKRIL